MPNLLCYTDDNVCLHSRFRNGQFFESGRVRDFAVFTASELLIKTGRKFKRISNQLFACLLSESSALFKLTSTR